MFCEIENLKLFYDIRGTGQPVLALHGFPTDHHMIATVLEPIFEQRPGYQRIYVDLPGMGQSTHNGIECSDDIVNLLGQFVDRVIPGQSFLVAGYSYGGLLSLGLLQQRTAQIDGALLICPVIVADDDQRALPSPMLLYQDPDLKIAPAERDMYVGTTTIITTELVNRIREAIFPGMQRADADFIQRLRANGYGLTLDFSQAQFPQPALIISGKQDAVVGYADAWSLHEQFPRGSFVTLDRAAHSLPMEQETLFTLLVNDWLDRVALEVPAR